MTTNGKPKTESLNENEIRVILLIAKGAQFSAEQHELALHTHSAVTKLEAELAGE